MEDDNVETPQRLFEETLNKKDPAQIDNQKIFASSQKLNWVFNVKRQAFTHRRDDYSQSKFLFEVFDNLFCKKDASTKQADFKAQSSTDSDFSDLKTEKLTGRIISERRQPLPSKGVIPHQTKQKFVNGAKIATHCCGPTKHSLIQIKPLSYRKSRQNEESERSALELTIKMEDNLANKRVLEETTPRSNKARKSARSSENSFITSLRQLRML